MEHRHRPCDQLTLDGRTARTRLFPDTRRSSSTLSVRPLSSITRCSKRTNSSSPMTKTATVMAMVKAVRATVKVVQAMACLTLWMTTAVGAVSPTWTKETKQAMREVAEQRLKQAMKDAVDEINSNGRGWGSVGASTRKAIQDFITPKVDWRKVLRYFIKTSQRANKRSTPRRINKRFPYIHSGKRVTRQAKIAISIDQSGSVSDECLPLFFSELSSLAKHAEFTIIPFDTDVDPDKVWVWKKGKKHTFERVLCGGTNFDAPTQYVNERDFDGHIVLTDMEAPKPKPSKCQRMWATTPQYAENPYFSTNERMLVMEP